MSRCFNRFERLMIAFVVALGAIALGPGAGAQPSQTAASPRPVWLITDGRLYRSTDGAEIWIPANNGLPQRTNLGALAVSQSAPEIAYVMAYPGQLAGLYKTRDGGQSWTRKMNGLPSPQRTTPQYVTIDPAHPQIVYSSWDPAGLFRSRDGGEHWRKLRGRICVPPGYGSVARPGCESLSRRSLPELLVLSPRNPMVMYASFEPSGFLFRSTDGGRTWRLPFSKAWVRRVCPGTRSCPLGEPFSVVMDPQHPSVLYALHAAGLWKTANAGRTWVRLIKSGAYAFALAVDPKRAGVVWRIGRIGQGWGLYKSTDGGRTWARKLRRAYYDDEELKLAVDPDSPDTVYVGGFGVLKTSNGGATWAPINDFREAYIDDLAVG